MSATLWDPGHRAAITVVGHRVDANLKQMTRCRRHMAEIKLEQTKLSAVEWSRQNKAGFTHSGSHMQTKPRPACSCQWNSNIASKLVRRSAAACGHGFVHMWLPECYFGPTIGLRSPDKFSS